MSLPDLILASSSPYRAELLDRLGLDYRQQSPEVDESEQPGETPTMLARRLAESKALALAEKFPKSVIIGSDQVPALGEEILRKPGDFENARKQLFACSGRSVVFHTGLCVHDGRSGTTVSRCILTEVKFRALSEAAIENYLRRDEPYDCAGAFRSEKLGMALFDSVHSSDPSALIGLPLIELNKMLLAVGVDALGR